MRARAKGLVNRINVEVSATFIYEFLLEAKTYGGTIIYSSSLLSQIFRMRHELLWHTLTPICTIWIHAVWTTSASTNGVRWNRSVPFISARVGCWSRGCWRTACFRRTRYSARHCCWPCWRKHLYQRQNPESKDRRLFIAQLYHTIHGNSHYFHSMIVAGIQSYFSWFLETPNSLASGDMTFFCFFFRSAPVHPLYKDETSLEDCRLFFLF